MGKEREEREGREKEGRERRHLTVFKAGCVIPSALKTVVLASVSSKQNRPAESKHRVGGCLHDMTPFTNRCARPCSKHYIY